jgi:PAS domain-containing protein
VLIMFANQTQTAAANAASVGGRSNIAVGTGEDVASLTLDDRGMVCDCNGAVEELFKYRRSELVWRHVSMLLPQLAELELMQNGQPNPRMRFLCRIGHRFQAVAQDGGRFASELFLNLLDNTGHSRLSLIVRPAEEAVGGNG